MNNSIESSILDNDPEGKSGRGTRFWLEVTINGNLSRYEYFLLDVIEKKFDLSSVISEALKHIEAERKAQEQAEKEQKQTVLQNREESVVISDALDAVLKSVIANNPRAVAEYQSGKEKALNSLVGLVIKEVKCKGISVEDGAFTITTLLKKSLAQ